MALLLVRTATRSVYQRTYSDGVTGPPWPCYSGMWPCDSELAGIARPRFCDCLGPCALALPPRPPAAPEVLTKTLRFPVGENSPQREACFVYALSPQNFPRRSRCSRSFPRNLPRRSICCRCSDGSNPLSPSWRILHNGDHSDCDCQNGRPLGSNMRCACDFARGAYAQIFAIR